MLGRITNATLSIAVASILLPGCTSANAASLKRANLLRDNGLPADAKIELIDVYLSGSATQKAQALYLLGTIAYEGNNVSGALTNWEKLLKEYPSSTQANDVKEIVSELASIVDEEAEERLNNAIASLYLKHGDFWSEGKDSSFKIDSSWIPNVESAIKWYDKTIAKYPGTKASRLAHEKKIRTLIGWTESGRYGSKYGVDESPSKYLPLLESAVNSYIQEHPKASSIQAFRFQVAQAYWNNKYWDKTREWLNIIIKNADGDTFYKDLATRRLLKVEY